MGHLHSIQSSDSPTYVISLSRVARPHLGQVKLRSQAVQPFPIRSIRTFPFSVKQGPPSGVLQSARLVVPRLETVQRLAACSKHLTKGDRDCRIAIQGFWWSLLSLLSFAAVDSPFVTVLK